jgi:hypothetical protein
MEKQEYEWVARPEFVQLNLMHQKSKPDANSEGREIARLFKPAIFQDT